jgi:flagellar protein FliS
VYGTGASVYRKVGIESEVLSADPHRLVTILFDGALQSIRQARALMGTREIARKCAAIGNALRIVDEGLKAAVEPGPDPQFSARLTSLYHYVEMRLLQANLRNDPVALDEAARILDDLRSAWLKIAPAARGSSRPALTVEA